MDRGGGGDCCGLGGSAGGVGACGGLVFFIVLLGCVVCGLTHGGRCRLHLLREQTPRRSTTIAWGGARDLKRACGQNYRGSRIYK